MNVLNKRMNIELLRKHVKTVAELGREQEYYDYNTVKGSPAYSIWSRIYAKCYGGSSLFVNRCYDDAFMCDEWKNNRDSFQEYKLFKESEIRILALRYKDKILEDIFDALIKCEVRPYSPYEG